MGILAWVAVGAGAAFAVLPAVKPPKIAWVPLLALVGLALWTLAAMGWTESQERTFNEFGRIVSYLGVVVLIMFGVGKNTWRLVAAGLLTAAVFVCGMTLLSRLWPSAFPVDTVAQNFGTTRISYPFGYWNAVGCWSAMTITLCLAYAAHARSWLVRALALAVVPMCACGLYLALSRAGIGGAVVGAVAVVFFAQYRWLTFLQTLAAGAVSVGVVLWLRKQTGLVEATSTDAAWSLVGLLVVAGAVLGAVAMAGWQFDLGRKLTMSKRVGRPLGWGVVGLAVLALVGAGFVWGGEAWGQFSETKFAAEEATTDARLAQLNGNRKNVWESSISAWEKMPVEGIGPGTFEFWWSRNGTNSEFVRDTHSVYLEALAETGLVGFGLVLVMFLFPLGAAAFWRASKAPEARWIGIHGGLIAVFAVFAFQAGFDWMWESTAVAASALVSITVAAAASSTQRPRAQASVSIAFLAVALATGLMLSVALASARSLSSSASEFASGDLDAALVDASTAVDTLPWSASAHAQRGLILIEQGKLGEAKSFVREAQRLEPTNWRWPLLLARTSVEQGEAGSASREFARYQDLRGHRLR